MLPARRRWLAAAVTLGATSLVAMSQLDRILQSMHLSGFAGAGIGGLAKGSKAAETVVERWASFATHLDGAHFNDGRAIATLRIAIDTVVFVGAYTTLLAVGAICLRRVITSRRASLAVAPDASVAECERYCRDRELLGRYRNALCIALAGVVALFIVDLVENAAELVLVQRGWSGSPDGVFQAAAAVLQVAALGKWILFALVAIPIVAAAFVALSYATTERQQLFDALSMLRVHLILAGVFAFLVLRTEQGIDVIRRWPDDLRPLVAAIVAAAWFGITAAAFGHRLVHNLDGRERRPVDPKWLALGGLGLVFVGSLAASMLHWGVGLAIPGGLALMVAFLSWLLGPIKIPPLAAVGFGSKALVAVLGAAPLASVGVGTVQAFVAQAFYNRHYAHLWFVGLGVALTVAAVVMFLKTVDGSVPAPSVFTFNRYVVVAGVAVAVVSVRLWLNVWRPAEVAGALALVAVFMVLATLCLGLLAFVSEWVEPPSALAMFRLKRVPVVALLVAWGLVAGTIDKGGFHDVRVQPDGATHPAVTVRSALARWLGHAGPAPASPAAGSSGAVEKDAVPLLLVVASGGGIRAAYWTASALSCVLEGAGRDCGGSAPRPGEPAAPVLAASGVSGGSVGLAAYVAHRLQPRGLGPNWVRTALGKDFVAPSVAWQLFVEGPNAFLRNNPDMDRAEVLERDWERAWESRRQVGDADPSDIAFGAAKEPDGALSRGLLETYADERPAMAGKVPLLLLSGTSVQDGCRFSASPLDGDNAPREQGRARADCLSSDPFAGPAAQDVTTAGPLSATWDLVNFLCADDDVRLSTAALLSARFPYVSPTGRLAPCHEDKHNHGRATYAVDGGYADASAASAMDEFWAGLEPLVLDHNRGAGVCLAPLVVQLDNGYSEPPIAGPGKRPQEPTAPLTGYLATHSSREANARQQLALEFSSPLAPDQTVVWADGKGLPRFERIYPRAHPGVEAPLGWTLSGAAMDDLDAQLFESNKAAIATVRRWLTPGNLRCRINSKGVAGG